MEELKSVYYDGLMKDVEESKKFFESYMEFARKIKYVVQRELEDAEVYVFGSVVHGNNRVDSDIDILVVSDDAPKTVRGKAELMSKIWEEVGHFTPFEIHIVSSYEFNNWYKNFVSKLEKV